MFISWIVIYYNDYATLKKNDYFIIIVLLAKNLLVNFGFSPNIFI